MVPKWCFLSTCTEAESTFNAGLEANTVMNDNEESEMPTFTGERSAALKHKFDCDVSESA